MGEGDRSNVGASGHTLDAVIAAYTGWLHPDGLEAPPEDFNLAAGWIWFPEGYLSIPRDRRIHGKPAESLGEDPRRGSVVVGDGR